MTSNIKYSWNIGVIVSVVGWYSRIVVKLPILGKSILGLSNRALGRLLPNLTFFGFRKEATYENAIWNWEFFLNIIGAEYKVDKTVSNSRTYTINRCPAGYCSLGHLNACKATMELDHSLVERSGGKLIVEKRIPIDGICIEKVVES